jgi:2-oxoglutarate ferredoxin oxidoreductase subunit gamma
MIKDGATVIIDEGHVTAPPRGHFRLLALPVTGTATALGNKRVANLVALGALIEVSGLCDAENLAEVVKARVPANLRDLNLAALKRGQALAAAARAPAA